MLQDLHWRSDCVRPRSISGCVGRTGARYLFLAMLKISLVKQNCKLLYFLLRKRQLCFGTLIHWFNLIKLIIDLCCCLHVRFAYRSRRWLKSTRNFRVASSERCASDSRSTTTLSSLDVTHVATRHCDVIVACVLCVLSALQQLFRANVAFFQMFCTFCHAWVRIMFLSSITTCNFIHSLR